MAEKKKRVRKATKPKPKPQKEKAVEVITTAKVVKEMCATCKFWRQNAPKLGLCFNPGSNHNNKNRMYDALCGEWESS